MPDAPTPPVAEPAPTYYVDSAGQLRPISADQAAEAEGMGWSPASAEEIRAHELQAKHGTPLEQAKTFGEAAASGLTLGGSRWLERALFGNEQEQKERAEANPTAETTGTVLGIAAPLILSGGLDAPVAAGQAGAAAARTGALAAARGAAELTAPALIARAGRAVTAGVEEALPEASGLLGKVLTHAASTGAGSAVEGAFYGLGQDVNEAALGDHDITAQSVLAHVGPMAAIGGGLGGLLGAGGELVPAALSRAREAIGKGWDNLKGSVKDWYAGAESVHGFNPATSQILIENTLKVDALEKEVPGIIESLKGAQPATAQSIIDNAGRFQDLEAALPGRSIQKTLVLARPDTLDAILQDSQKAIAFEQAVPGALKNISQADPATAKNFLDNWSKLFKPGQDPERMAMISAVRKSGNEILDSTEQLFKKAYGEMMREGSDALLADANPAAIVGHYDGIWGEVQGAADMMAERPTIYKPYFSSRLRQIMEDVAKESGEYVPGQAAAPQVAFDRLVLLRKQIGDMRVFGNVRHLPVDEQQAQPVLKHLYNKISEALTDPEAFGEAARQKAALDEVYTEWRRLADRKPGASLGRSEKGTVNLNELLMKGGEFAPSKVNSWFNNFDSDTAQLRTEAWGRMMDVARKAVDTVDKLHEAAPVTAFDREAVDSLLSKSADIYRNAQERAELTSAYNRLDPRAVLRGSHAVLPGEPPAAAAAASAVGAAQAAAGFMGHGPITSTVKAVLSPIATAVETAKSMPKSVAMLATLERIGNTVSRAVDRAAGIAVRGSSLASTVGRAEVEAGIAREFAAEPDAALARFNRRVGEIQRLSSDPNALHEALLEQSKHLDAHAPNTSQALSIASARTVTFLASKIPQDPMRGPLAPKWEPSQSEIARFSRYYEAAKDPLVVLKQAAAGTLTPEAVETVKTCYPDLWAKKILPAIMDKLATPGLQVPAANRLSLSMLTGQDLDGRLSQLRANQLAHQKPTNRQSGLDAVKPTATALGRVTMSDRMQTPMQRSAQRTGRG